MPVSQLHKSIGAVASFVAIIAGGMLISTPRGFADDDNGGESKIEAGLKIAPVALNLSGRNRGLVGLGSYIVNAQSDCNGCHSRGPQTEFTANGNPYLLPPIFNGKKKINPATYLGGGNDFGPLGPPDNPGSHIVSRNLTPDKTGRPEGGHTFTEFLQIIRTGVDMDRLHPRNCSATITGDCVPFPFNGALLQIMPWSAFQDMTDYDIRAIYEYLSAVPCIDTIDPKNPQLRNVCK